MRTKRPRVVVDRRHRRVPWLVLALVAASGCGAARSGAGTVSEDMLRSPRTLERRLDAALRADPGDLRAGLVRAYLLDSRGRPEEALRAWIALVDASSSSRDPLAPDTAEVAVHAIEDLEERAPGWLEAVGDSAARRVERPGTVGPLARHTLAEIRARIALRRGDATEARRREAEAGCAGLLRVAGPFGPRDLLDFERVLPPERPGRLRAAYDLGPGRGIQRTRTVRATACVANIGGDVLEGGSTVSVGWVDVRRTGAALLRVESPNSLRVSVNGLEVLEVDTRPQPEPRVHLVPVSLPAGPAKIAMVVGSRHPNPVLLVSLLDDDGMPAGEWLDEEPVTHTAAALRVENPPPAGSLDALVAAGEQLDEAERFLLALRSLGRGETVRARSALAEMRSPLARVLQGVAALSDAALPDELRRERARRAFRRALEADPDLWQARIQSARLLAAEDRLDDALAELREAARRSPDEAETHLLLSDLYVARGWEAQAEEAVGHARSANAEACRPLAALYGAVRRRSDMAAAEEVARAHAACDARSVTLFDVLRTARRYEEAADEAERLLALDPESPSVWQELASLRLATGDSSGAREALRRALTLRPQDPELRRSSMDVLAADGDVEGGVAAIAEPLALSPGQFAVLQRPRALLERRNLFGAFRLDGDEVIREFETSGRTYDAPSILVLDYTVVRVFSDGSSLELTHNIVRVQSDEGVEQWGEWSAPEGADILKVQTVKADGTHLEPEEVAGKETLSLPNLAPGDYVEYEYLGARSPPGGFPGGYFGDRFYFQSFEIPFDRTELVMVVPLGIDLEVSPRDGAPAAREESWGELRILRFRHDAVPALVQEPRSVASREYLPSVQISRGATWRALVDSMRDQLVDRNRRDPEVEALVARLTRDAESRSERARILWRWVLENVDDEGDPFGPASQAILSKRGSRVRALHALLRAAGVGATLALARDVVADRTPSAIADADTYEHFLVRVETEEGITWLAPWDRYLPYEYLPAAVAGQPVLLLAEAPAGEVQRGELPVGPPDRERHDIEVEATLATDGSATVRTRETYRGADAARWRGMLSEVPASDRETRFEHGYLGRMVEGATLHGLRVDGLDDPDQPLVFEYEYDAPRIARARRDSMRLRSLYPMVVGPDYAPLPRRETTLAVSEEVDIRVDMTILLPDGARVSGPAAVQVEGPLGRYEARSEVQGDRFSFGRHLLLRAGRVEPDHYGDFAEFCRTVDRAETSEIRIDLR